MFKDVLTHADMVYWAEMGLVMFFAVFVLTTAWAMSRPKKLIESWSVIPLGSGDEKHEGGRHD